MSRRQDGEPVPPPALASLPPTALAQKRTAVHVSRRGSITIQQSGDNDGRFSQMFAASSSAEQEASLGLPLHASSDAAASLRVDHLEQSRLINPSRVSTRHAISFAHAGRAHHQRQMRQLQQRHPSQFSETGRSTVVDRSTSASEFQPQQSLQRQPRSHQVEYTAGLSPQSRNVIDSVYDQVDRSLDSMRSKHSMSIESALRHMRSRLPTNLDKLGEVAYDRLVEYVSEMKRREEEENDERSEKRVLASSFRKIVKELEDLSQQNKQLRAMLDDECSHSSKISMRLNEALDQVDRKWAEEKDESQSRVKDNTSNGLNTIAVNLDSKRDDAAERAEAALAKSRLEVSAASEAAKAAREEAEATRIQSEEAARKTGAVLRASQEVLQAREIEEVFLCVVSQTKELLSADRATLFLVDSNAQQLWSKVAHGRSEPIRIPLDSGIVGKCVSKNESIRIADAYEYPGFNKSVDMSTGYRTKAVLVAPVRGPQGCVLGALQVINKLGFEREDRGDQFDESDEITLATFCDNVAIAVNACKRLEKETKQTNDKMLQIEGMNKKI
jgi:putative methionine-R-sulfoxide reductase with GAF domain